VSIAIAIIHFTIGALSLLLSTAEQKRGLSQRNRATLEIL